jgi:AcrR family transcriptional regulator
MKVVDSWTGATADALRQAFRMTIEDFAAKLGVHPRTVSYWRGRPDMVQRTLGQQILDDALERAPETVKARFAALIGKGFSADPIANGSLPGTSPGLPLPPSPASAGDISAENARSILAWIEASNTSDDFISYFDQTIEETAKEHASYPPATLLAKVQQLHGMIQTLLRGGKQRYRQTRELLRLDADLLAHMCQLLGDVHRDEAAAAYAAASVGLAEEAGSSAAAAFSAQAQTRFRE